MFSKVSLSTMALLVHKWQNITHYIWFLDANANSKTFSKSILFCGVWKFLKVMRGQGKD